MKEKLRQIPTLKICLALILSLSIFPEVFFSNDNTNEKVQIYSVSSEDTNSCNEHNCPVLPNELYHHCSVCCTISHSFTNQSTEFVFHFNNSSHHPSVTEDVFHKELFAKTLFRPPQSIL